MAVSRGAVRHGFSFTPKDDTPMAPSPSRHSLCNIATRKITFQHDLMPWDTHAHRVSELSIFIVQLKHYEEKKQQIVFCGDWVIIP